MLVRYERRGAQRPYSKMSGWIRPNLVKDDMPASLFSYLFDIADHGDEAHLVCLITALQGVFDLHEFFATVERGESTEFMSRYRTVYFSTMCTVNWVFLCTRTIAIQH